MIISNELPSDDFSAGIVNGSDDENVNKSDTSFKNQVILTVLMMLTISASKIRCTLVKVHLPCTSDINKVHEKTCT